MVDEIELVTGERLRPGSLNVLVDKPLKLKADKAIYFEGGQRMLWPAALNGVPVWLYRWRDAPLHVAEFVAAHHLRDALDLVDGESVEVAVDDDLVEPSPKLAWALLWKGRERWVYTRKGYNRAVCRLSRITGFAFERTWSVVPITFNSILRKLRLGGAQRHYKFSRTSTNGLDQEAREIRQVLNLRNYTKTSDSSYSAGHFPAGYHSIVLHGRRLEGQRDPVARLKQVPLDFTGKSVLDLGSNQGGMLLPLASILKWGVGADFDPRMVNAANRTRAIQGSANLNFYVFDLEKENLQILRDLLPEERVDVCFLLSVCMWLPNWKQVIDAAASLSDAIVFESNGSSEQQEDQIRHLKSVFESVSLLADQSDDDPGQKNRKLLLAQHSKN